MHEAIGRRLSMQLRELQEQFTAEVLDKQPGPVQGVIEPRGFLPEQRLKIYRNNIYSTLIESLQSIYPVSCTMVGEEFFRSMARAYIRTHIPETGDLRDYGETLPAFMESMPELENFPYMPDVAKIDWACHVSFHADSAPALTVSKLNEFSPDTHEHLILHLHPAVSPINSNFPIFDIWEFGTANDPDCAAPDLNAHGQSVLVYRKNNAVKVANVDSELFTMVDLASKEHTLGKIIATILEMKPDYNLKSGLYQLFSFDTVRSITVRHQ